MANDHPAQLPHVEVLWEAPGVATLVLTDPPKRNAMTEALGDALAAAVATLKGAAGLRAVVLRGAGDAFSAGGDLGMLERLRQVPKDTSIAHMRAFYARYLSILELPVPVVASVQGPAIGAGLCVALAADLMVVAEDATLAFNFTTLGLHPGMGATYFLPRRVGPQRAAELLFTGRRFGGEEACRMGLAVASAPADAVHARALALAGAVAQAGPQSVRAVKATLGIDAAALDAALLREAQAQADSYLSDELGEGLAAVRAKRRPQF